MKEGDCPKDKGGDMTDCRSMRCSCTMAQPRMLGRQQSGTRSKRWQRMYSGGVPKDLVESAIGHAAKEISESILELFLLPFVLFVLFCLFFRHEI